MTNLIRMAYLIVVTMFLLNLTAVLTFASDDPNMLPGAKPLSNDDDSGNGSELGEGVQVEDEPVTVKKAETHTIMGGFTGYRFLSVDNYGVRAAQYDYLHSGVIGGGYINSLGQELKFSLDGAILNEKDYHGDMLFDYGGEYRFHARTESLFHNLTGENLFDAPFQLPRADVRGALADYLPHQDDSLTKYGVRTEQDLASFRYKLRSFPLHINVGYWRMVKEGASQLRFADIAFEGPENNFIARSKSVNRETHEGNLGLDTHLGPIDLIYNFQIRQFGDSAGQLRDDFAPRYNIQGGLERRGGLQEHNEEPDSRYYAHTVKLHTSLAGGVVGAASYTYGRRDNLSKLIDTTGARLASVDLHNAAGDFVYTPFKEFSMGLKYRRQEVDNGSPPSITNSFFVQNPLAVRSSISTEKDMVIASMLFRPSNLFTIKGEYKGEFLHRDLPSNNDERLIWFLNENQDTHRGTIALLSRPLKGLRLNAHYSYTTTDHPSYGTSFANKHEGELLTSYNCNSRWGVTANYRGARESNDQIERRTIVSIDPIKYSIFSPLLSRDKTTNNVTAGVWFVLFDKLTVSANYGYLQSSIDQAVLFTASGSEDASNYTSKAQFYTLNSTYLYSEKTDISLTLQQMFSFSEFSPEDASFSPTDNTSGIKEISHLKTIETSFSARGNHRITKNLTCSLEYQLKDYDDKYSSLFDGTVHIVTAYVSAKW